MWLKHVSRLIVPILGMFCLLADGNNLLRASENGYSISDFENMPLDIVTEGVTPLVMIATSNDHQLFYAAYNDYTDLDDDGVADTTYTHSIDYYGYFDSYKCYIYDTSDARFEPDSVTEDKYCNAGNSTGQWSGNFLNWLSMSRIDTIRKILFGGHRRTDSATETVLERAYIPHDAHSFAKYYAGSDLPDLTPFSQSTSTTTTTTTYNKRGKPTTTTTTTVTEGYYCDSSTLNDTDGCDSTEEKMGITFCNTTDVDMSDYSNKFSEDYNEPPRIKVVKGNYSLWASNERWQCTWADSSDYDNHSGVTNSNDATASGINAYSSSPSFDESLGEGNYTARVQVCVDGLLGDENCKAYPDGNYKPVGILQTYGDDGDMSFGMVSGTYADHASGGGLIRNIGSISDEINVDSDGTFSHVAVFASDNGVANDNAKGIINAWSLFRIVGYNGASSAGFYNSANGDNCTWGISTVANQIATNKCQNWVNPFSEIYYQAVNYFSGNGLIPSYYANTASGTKIPGLSFLTADTDYEDPLCSENYCANLYIINLNTSTSSYDYDQLDTSGFDPSSIWDTNDLPASETSSAMTDAVGDAEGITDGSYFIGESSIDTDEDQLCTAKTITNFGEVGGMCPEEPRLRGSYRVSGLAYYAHVKDIRPDDVTDGRALESSQTINTYSVALAPGTPKIEVPDPQDTSAAPLVTILPACRNQSLTPDGNCALVAFKIVSQETDADADTARGKYYINWEDSEMGGDHDQDMWGTLTYELSAQKKLTITTEIHAESTTYAMGFGYIISGTENDGFHAHSGITSFKYNDIADNDVDCSDSDGCASDDGSSSKIYIVGDSATTLLEDPLWYAAKYGGFSDADGNNLPDDQQEWDSEDNSTGESNPDGIPDNYYYATNPEELESSLTRVLDAILDRTSSGTSAAVVSANVDGEGAVYSAYYQPSKTSTSDSSIEASWFGTLTALWLDSSGYSRQDCTPDDNDNIDDDGNCTEVVDCVPNGELDNYCVDQVVESYYNESDDATYMRIYESNDPDSFTAYSMQGVVSAFNNGTVTMLPNSMEGMAEYSDTTLTITPYEIHGTITEWDETTGEATISIDSWSGPDNEAFTLWKVTSADSAATGSSTSSISFETGTPTLTISPAGTWLSIGDSLTLQTKNRTGNEDDVFTDWTIKCLDDSADIDGYISSGSEKLTNDESTVAEIVTSNGDFSSCERAIFYTYAMTGTEGDTFSSWEVTNIDNTETDGTSSTSMTLANDGTISFSVSPTDEWMEVGDRVEVANFASTTVSLDDVSYLWNAREELYLTDLSDSDIAINRTYSDPANYGRFITTWIDEDLDNTIDQDEYREFDNYLFSDTNFDVSPSFFDVASEDDAKELIEYIRGVDKDGSRNRTIQYSADDSDTNVMRLGDIINSTPTAVTSPQDSYDLIYNDASYLTFKQQYINRRHMIYVGANDGMIHAFNGGFYTETTDDDGTTVVSYSTSGTQYDGTTAATEHPLGSEVWAYVPMNLLPHLQWLKDTSYSESHVSYIDSKPKVFEAKIFEDDDDHPNGWGTVMVVGMNLGGGSMTIDIEKTDFTFHSSYVVIDVTNPEVEPEVLGEITPPDHSFTSVYPAVAAFRDVGDDTSCGNNDTACNSWYLIFGSGPNDLSSVENTKSTKVYLFDLKQLIDPTVSSTKTMSGADTCEVTDLNSSYKIISCDTGIDNTFMGTPVTVDWDLDFKADTLYFGLIRNALVDIDFDADTSSDSGRVLRMPFNNDADYTNWSNPVTFFNAERALSIYSSPLPAYDDKGNHWLFFGSGRYFSIDDKTSTETQSLFGVKDYEYSDEDNYPVTQDSLLDVSDVGVYTDGSLQETLYGIDATTELTSFDDIETYIDSDAAAGWYLDLPPITGEQGVDPSTRNITSSVLYSSALLTTVFQPSEDPCEGEGASRLYGLYYKTGTGYASSSILGSTTETVNGTTKYLTTTYINLGSGNASAPTLSTSSSGDSMTVYTQLSTGATVQTDINPITVSTGRSSWTDQETSK
jgi:Tfp pilus tip-associated adhesin PilY1